MTTALEAYLQQQQANQQQSLGNFQMAQALQGMQQKAVAGVRDEAYRREIAALGPNPSQEALVAVTAKYASPDKLMDVQQKSLDRKAQAEDTALRYAQMFQQREDALEERRRQFDATRASAEERRKFEEWYKAQQLQNTQQVNNLNAQLRAMGLEIQKQGQQLQIQRFDAQQREREEREIEGQIGKTSDRMKDVMPVWTSANQLNGILSRYKPDEVPGLGYAKNTDIGKAFLTPEGKDVSSSIKLFGNSVLKAMSGAAVTAPEEIRQMAAQMADGRFSAQDFYIAWPKMAEWVNSQVQLGTAGLTPKAKERFIDRTGIKIDPIKPRFTFENGALVDSQGQATTTGPKKGDVVDGYEFQGGNPSDPKSWKRK
jgi:hypothetical protein